MYSAVYVDGAVFPSCCCTFFTFVLFLPSPNIGSIISIIKGLCPPHFAFSDLIIVWGTVCVCEYEISLRQPEYMWYCCAGLYG